MSLNPNLQQLHFHDVHGRNLVLKHNNLMACRQRNFDSVVFTNRPVTLFEPIVFQITKTELNFNGSGGLSIGFTIYDPFAISADIVNNSNVFLLPKHGIWTLLLPESLNKIGTVVSFYVDFDGDVFYDVNNGKKTYLLSNVNTAFKLWAIIGIFGTVNEIALLNSGSLPLDIEKAASKRTESSKNVSFHANHGEPVCLTNDGTIAYKNQSLYAYVFSNRSFKLNEKLIVSVHMLLKGKDSKETFEYGITSTDPSQIEPNDLPENAGDLLSFHNYWVIYKDRNDYKSGDIIIFTLTSDGKFIVVKNCASRVCFLHVDIKQPLWLFLKLNGAVAEISLRESSTKDYFSTLTEKDLLKITANNENLGSYACTTPKTFISNTMKECLICFENNVDSVIYRCGHICMCYECAHTAWLRRDFDKCPLCRVRIQDIIRTF